MKEMPYELPKASEKLAFKFILDSLKEENLAGPAKEEAATAMQADEAPTGTAQESVAEQKEKETASVEACGTQAPESVSPEEPMPESIPMEELRLPSGKKYFRIKEVSALIGVEPYVLRYWESEFSAVKPAKSASGHRVYSRKDIEALHLIRHLLHVERFSIKGAKQKLLERRKQLRKAAKTIDFEKHTLFLKDLASELKELIQLVQGHHPG